MENSKKTLKGVLFMDQGDKHIRETPSGVPINFQSAHPGGATEQKRAIDCDELLRHLRGCYAPPNTRQLARELKWSKRRVRSTLQTVRGKVEKVAVTGKSGALEHLWILKEVDEGK